MSNTDARVRTVEEHVARENEHDLGPLVQTFSDTDACFDDEPWDEHNSGRDGVRAFYEGLFYALPDLHIVTRRRYVAEDAITLEVLVTGTHQGTWRGIPGTGRHLEYPLCAIFTFDDQDRVMHEKVYYDRATVLQQLGLFHEPSVGLTASPPH